MRKANVAAAVIWIIGLLLVDSLWAQEETTGMPLPSFSLPVPKSEADRLYLGLADSTSERFNINDIEADILLIELFSMYCPFCQEEAPLINEFFDLTQQLPASGPQVKIIGLGAGNTDFEVEHFRTTFDVEFPLFADQDLAIYQALEGEGTPGFIGSRKDRESGFVIVLRQSGGFYDKNDFLKKLLAKGTPEDTP